jgi:hypothetical protein
MKMMLDISRTLVYRFAWLMAEGKATRHDAAVLKLHAGETYKRYPIWDCRSSAVTATA